MFALILIHVRACKYKINKSINNLWCFFFNFLKKFSISIPCIVACHSVRLDVASVCRMYVLFHIICYSLHLLALCYAIFVVVFVATVAIVVRNINISTERKQTKRQGDSEDML